MPVVIVLGARVHDDGMDHAGLDTYDSMYRARHIFGVTRALVVTQKFHLARAVYTAEHVGIDAIGVSIIGRSPPCVWTTAGSASGHGELRTRHRRNT